VVRKNLKLCFPSKTQKELRQIEKDFYIHFCDLYLEMIKSLSMNAETMKRRFKYTNPEKIAEIEKHNKSIVYMAAHYANFEWMTSFQLCPTKRKGFGVYKRIRNPYFDKLIKGIRSKFFIELIDKNEISKLMREHHQKGELVNYGMIADQAPRHTNKAYWGKFMGLETPMFVGTEIFAKKHDLALAFIHIKKVKRGFYEAELKEITTEPKSFGNFEITDSYFQMVEKEIEENPALYFWTHKRWKHYKK
jgi:KDO2-lipid IV(A) lauroyltransferase